MGQAKADTEEAKKQINKAVKELDDIKDELINLKDINTADLDQLGMFITKYLNRNFKKLKLVIYFFFLEKRLDAVEAEVARANLTGRIEKFREMRNIQKKSIDKYEKEMQELVAEVTNVRLISEALPAECFSRSRLEP